MSSSDEVDASLAIWSTVSLERTEQEGTAKEKRTQVKNYLFSHLESILFIVRSMNIQKK
jgi:hypothetical protein